MSILSQILRPKNVVFIETDLLADNLNNAAGLFYQFTDEVSETRRNTQLQAMESFKNDIFKNVKNINTWFILVFVLIRCDDSLFLFLFISFSIVFILSQKYVKEYFFKQIKTHQNDHRCLIEVYHQNNLSLIRVISVYNNNFPLWNYERYISVDIGI